VNQTAWTPKSVLALRDYNGRKFGADLAAGVTVGLVALPRAVNPEDLAREVLI
jgi:MFS superfamily sulfate permease-like transporter